MERWAVLVVLFPHCCSDAKSNVTNRRYESSAFITIPSDNDVVRAWCCTDTMPTQIVTSIIPSFNSWRCNQDLWHSNGEHKCITTRCIRFRHNSPLHYTPKAIQVTSLVPTFSFAYTDIVKLLVVKFCMPQLGTALPTLDVFVPTQANTWVNGILKLTLVVLVCTNPHCCLFANSYPANKTCFCIVGKFKAWSWRFFVKRRVIV